MYGKDKAETMRKNLSSLTKGQSRGKGIPSLTLKICQRLHMKDGKTRTTEKLIHISGYITQYQVT
jgi:hypothetical protein